MNKNFGLANFDKNFAKRTSPNAAKVIKTLYKQVRNLKFFGAGEVSWNRDSSINISCTTYNRKAPQGKKLLLFLQDTLKLHFK